MNMKKRDLVVQVNKRDKKIKLVSKLEAHLNNGILHRAIAVIIFDKEGNVLLQKRSKEKMLWPMYWDMSCASHPFDKEDYVKAGKRRLKEELGFTTELKLLGKFFYEEKYKNIGAEKELCALLVGEYSSFVKVNKKEVAQVKWVNFGFLLEDIKRHSGKYSPWFRISLEKFLPEIRSFYINTVLKNLSYELVPYIKKILNFSMDKKFWDLSLWPILTGGKRLRPALVLSAYWLLEGKNKQQAYSLGATLEILHNYTLIVDDIIDNSVLRRGKATLWKKYGQSMALCTGMNYTASLLEGMILIGSRGDILELLSKTLKSITEGEMLDVLFEQGGRKDDFFVSKNRVRKVDLKSYFQMIKKKTAVLFEASLLAGGMLASTSKYNLRQLASYGLNLGIAFQITDDILDIFGDKNFGKKIGKDIEEHKEGNVIILLALNELKGNDKKSLLDILRKEKIGSKDINLAIKLIKKTQAKEKAYKLAVQKIKKAKKSLKQLPFNKWNVFLEQMADYILERNI